MAQITQMTNHEWILDAIAKATLIERLTLLSHEIKMDQEAGIDYTLDDAGMKEIRAKWGLKMKQLKESKNDAGAATG